MKLINYDKYKKKWTPRSTVVVAVIQAFVTGLFLGTALMVATHSHNIWGWIWLLAMGFGSGIGALEATLVALHNWPASNDNQGIKPIPHNAGVL